MLKMLRMVSIVTSVFHESALPQMNLSDVCLLSMNTVCMVFTDIVGFSRISMHITPTVVMDMLSNLFSRFDELCDVHGVLKLE